MNNDLRIWWFINWCRITNYSRYCYKHVVVKYHCLKMWTVIHERSCTLINKSISFHSCIPCYFIIIIIIIIVTNFITLAFIFCSICTSRRSETKQLIFFKHELEIRKTKANKLLINFSFWLQWTAGCIFECETTKMELARKTKQKKFLTKNVFV